MRSYPNDSQEAVCRLLALSMIVDGHVAPSEVKAMQQSAILQRVGADADTFDQVVHALCDDLLANAIGLDCATIALDRSMLDGLLGEIADPLLRLCTLKAMLEVVDADRLVDSREHLLLQRALRTWSAPGPDENVARRG